MDLNIHFHLNGSSPSEDTKDTTAEAPLIGNLWRDLTKFVEGIAKTIGTIETKA